MPRSNRPRRSGRPRRAEPAEPLDLGRIQASARRTEYRHGREWVVQPIRAERALKVYQCPGCFGEIAVGVPHLAVWSADSIHGDDVALGERRHWHRRCWQIS